MFRNKSALFIGQTFGTGQRYLVQPLRQTKALLPSSSALPLANRGFEMDIVPSVTLSSSDVLSNEDIFSGTILAFALAFLFSFLQGRTPSSSNIKLWPEESNSIRKVGEKEDYAIQKDSNSMHSELVEDKNDDKKLVFDGDDWEEVSKPENYVMYKTKVRKDIDESSKPKRAAGKSENRLVLVALLILFVPIFSVEFFFALSRQFICGDFVTQVDDNLWLTDSDRAISASNGISPWARQLCSPYTE